MRNEIPAPQSLYGVPELEPENESEVRTQLEGSAKTGVERAELEVGDLVRLLQKPALGGRSGHRELILRFAPAAARTNGGDGLGGPGTVKRRKAMHHARTK